MKHLARLAALEALCALKHSNRRELAEKLLSDASVAVRKGAARLLGALGHDARPALERACADSHPLVRLAAARALSENAGKAARAALEKLASKDAEPGVRAVVLRLLKKL